VLGSDTVFVSACGAGTCTTESVPGTEGRDVVRSPRGDRAALLTHLVGDPGAPGAPVVDVTLGKVAYRVTGLREATGAAFSGDGDTLYVAGASASDAFAVAAVRAADGAALTARPLDFAPCAVAADPGGAWLYVAGITDAGQSRLQVFDRASLTAITTLHVTSSVAFGHSDRLCHIMPNPTGHVVYIVDSQAGHDPAARAQLFSFETPR
jgi:DNA-binding beta-propeller fold protein YncE